MPGTETKSFDPALGFAPLTKTDGITDATVARRGNRWWMAAAGTVLLMNYRGPYNIGDLEWDGVRWVDQPAPVFVANEDWEHASVYEPNLIFHDGKWKMWYVAGSNLENYIVHGYAKSEDGRTGWTKHKVFSRRNQDKMLQKSCTVLHSSHSVDLQLLANQKRRNMHPLC